MAMPELEVEIDAKGRVTVHVKGMKGKRCLEVARLLEQVLGRAGERQLTAEYYEQEEKSEQRVDVNARRRE